MKNTILFAGSTNPQSINLKLVTAIATLLVETKNTVLDLTAYDMPMYSMAIQKAEGPPTQALQLKQIIAQADLLIIAVPEHNGSMPSFFKNILDWLSRSGEDYRAFHNKEVILLSASPGGGGESVLAHTETVLNRLGAIVKAKISVSNFFSKATVVENRLQLTDNTILDQIRDVIKNNN